MKPWIAALASLAVLPILACGSPATTPPATPLAVTQRKCAVMDAVGKPVYCDPDYYPIARPGNEQANAITKYPEIRADAETSSAIVVPEHLPYGRIRQQQ